MVRLSARRVARPTVAAVLFAMSVWLVAGGDGGRRRAEAAEPGPGGPGVTSAMSEHFNDIAAGQMPAGWGVDTSGGSVAVQALPDAVDRSLAMAKTGSAGSVAVERRASAALTGTVHAEARVRVGASAGWFNVLYLADGTGTPVASIAVRDGRFYDVGGGAYLVPAAASRWYVLRAVLHTGAQRFDLFVDGQRVLAGAPFRQAAGDVARVGFGIGTGQTGTLNVDNVSMRRVPEPSTPYHAFDLFDDVAVGSAPDGYTRPATAGTVAVAAVPSAEDRSLRIAKPGTAGEAAVVRSFPAQTGTVTVLANVRTEQTAGTTAALYVQSTGGGTAAAVQFSNGNLQVVTDSAAQVLVSGVRATEWYTIRLVLDVPARAFVAYVDGRRHPAVGTTSAPTRFPFRDRRVADIGRLWFAVGAGQTGTLHVDKVMVYPASAKPTGAVVDVRDHGARGDGTGNDGPAIQAAIDAVPSGGSVYLAGGVFRSGTIFLKSDMTLFIAPDAMLLGTRDEAAYPRLRGRTPDNPPFVGGNVQKALIHSHRADNIVIEGGGVINGDGRNPAWAGEPPASGWPAGIFLARGRNITIRNIHVKDTATWNIVPTEVTGLRITDVDVDNDVVGTRDGIDVVDSDDVLVERVAVYSDDDAICFKSHATDTGQVEPGSPSYGVDGAVVRLSTVGASTRANGVKLGTAGHGAFRDIVVEDMLVKNIHIGALVVTAVDGGIVNSITFRRITVDGTKRAIFVLIGRRVWTDGAGVSHPALDPKWVSGLRFEAITATRIAEGQPGNHLGNAVAMSGTTRPGTTATLYDILVSGSRFALASGGTAGPAEPDEYDGRYPEAWYWTNLNAYGAFLRHIDGITLRDVSFTVPDPRGRPATDIRDVRDLAP